MKESDYVWEEKNDSSGPTGSNSITSFNLF